MHTAARKLHIQEVSITKREKHSAAHLCLLFVFSFVGGDEMETGTKL